MTNVDLFEHDLPVDEERSNAPVQAELLPPPAGTVRRRARSAAASPLQGGRHFRLAMRAARRLPRSDERDRTRRLICHHLRRMLDDDDPASVPARPPRRAPSAA